MEYQIELPEEISNIHNFQSLLEKYRDYKSCIREIRINSVIGKKTLFEIEDINPPIFCDFSNTYRGDVSLSKTALTINKLSFKIDSDMRIISHTVDYEILKTRHGKLITELQSLGIRIKISPTLYITGIKETPQIMGFHINSDNITFTN